MPRSWLQTRPLRLVPPALRAPLVIGVGTPRRSVGSWEPGGFGVRRRDQNGASGRLIWLLFLCDDPAVGLRVTTCGWH